MLISQLLQLGVAELRKCGITSAEIDVQLLLGHCLGKSRTQLFLAARDVVEEADIQRFHYLIGRRTRYEPVAYILGEREFWSLPFLVDKSVLIPRPETEFLLQCVLDTVERTDRQVDEVADLCSGSGVIAVILALELQCRICAIDCSEKALSITRKNCREHGVDQLVEGIQSDLFTRTAGREFDLIVSNPPYVCTDDIHLTLEPEVAHFEPHLALDGGVDGLDLIRRMASESPLYLRPGGMFFMEFGAEQGVAVQELFSSVKTQGRFFEQVELYQDYSGRDRVLQAQVNNYKE